MFVVNIIPHFLFQPWTTGSSHEPVDCQGEIKKAETCLLTEDLFLVDKFDVADLIC